MQIDNLFTPLTDEKFIADTPAYNLLQKDKSIIKMTMIGTLGYTHRITSIFWYLIIS